MGVEEVGLGVAVGRTASKGAGPGPGVKMFLNLAQKRLTTTFAIVSPWHKHTQPSSACSLSLSLPCSPPLSLPFCRCTFSFLSLILDKLLQSTPPFLAENMPQGMNTLSQLIASAGNNLETALLLLCESALPLFWTIPFYTHTQTHTLNFTLCPTLLLLLLCPEASAKNVLITFVC